MKTRDGLQQGELTHRNRESSVPFLGKNNEGINQLVKWVDIKHAYSTYIYIPRLTSFTGNPLFGPPPHVGSLNLLALIFPCFCLNLVVQGAHSLVTRHNPRGGKT